MTSRYLEKTVTAVFQSDNYLHMIKGRLKELEDNESSFEDVSKYKIAARGDLTSPHLITENKSSRLRLYLGYSSLVAICEEDSS
jgi:hypothetical protein